ncbi:MAG: 23S rRNA (adenine(2503)-C(2))-methyltransferase RlmN [Verrucomicrobiota bacterium]
MDPAHPTRPALAGMPPNAGSSALPDRKTGVSPVREDSASRLSTAETTGGTPVGHDRRDACPPAKLPVSGMSPEALAAWLKEAGQPAFRGAQILDWIWKKKAGSLEAMTNLPATLRAQLSASFRLNSLQHTHTQGAADTTRKFLFRLHDGRYVESVLIPANPALYGEASDRHTLCVSSQVGCAYGCRFCASGLAGFARNLEAAEIADQVLAAERLSGERVDNLVFMGMGEPLANLDNLLAAIALITGPQTLHLGARHLTISTAGLVPQIRRLAEHPQQIRLAISLHGATDAVREKIMPVNRKWPLADLLESLDYWNSLKKQKLTLEYILIAGINDALEQAALLARHARRLHAKVNLIPYNTVDGLEWQRPSDAHCTAFLNTLKRGGVAATLRLEKGHDIDAACGQLRLQQETAEGILAGAPPPRFDR